MKLSVKAFAFTTALVWGLGLFLLTWWIILFEGSSEAPTFIGMLYRGYTISPVGSVIGLLWALVDGFIGGAIFAWLYNALTGCCICRSDHQQAGLQETADRSNEPA